MRLTLSSDGVEMNFQIRNLDMQSNVCLPVFLLSNIMEVSSQEGTIIEGPFRKAPMVNLHSDEVEVATKGIMTGNALRAYFIGVNGPMTITDPKNV